MERLCVSKTAVLLLIYSLSITGVVSQQPPLYLDDARDIFVSNIAQVVGNGTHILPEFLERYFVRHGIQVVDGSYDDCLTGDPMDPFLNRTCLLRKCLDPVDVYTLSGIDNDVIFDDGELSALSAMLLHLMDNSDCMITPPEEESKHKPPTKAAVWGYSILCVTVINLSALTGIVVMPFMHGDTYKKTLIWMVGLAVGTLAGSSLLFLLPEALELTEAELNAHSYIWKCLVVIGGLCIFFNLERILKIITEARERKQQAETMPDYSRRNSRRRTTVAALDFSSFHLARMVQDAGIEEVTSDGRRLSTVNEQKEKEANVKEPKGGTKSHNNDGLVKPIAWMIVFGDALHNFIDGVSIGAAFTDSILAGVSVSVAIICDEFPHELGDFAVLVNSGMSIKRAVGYNFLSAITCYMGLVVGILIGENEYAHTWVFAFAAGMFLYIALVDMMPEMAAAAESEDNVNISGKMIFFLQNFGMITGFGVMVILAIYGGQLESLIQGE